MNNLFSESMPNHNNNLSSQKSMLLKTQGKGNRAKGFEEPQIIQLNRPCTTVRDSEDILEQSSFQKYTTC